MADEIVVSYGEQRQKDTQIETYEQRVKGAVADYDPKNRAYATYLNDGSAPPTVTYSDLTELAQSPQSNLSRMQRIIEIARQYVNLDDIIGLTYESIENNINTRVRFSYRGLTPEQRKKVKEIIEDFNEQINLPQLIVQSVSSTWRDGTFIACLREKECQEHTSYVVDYYPLGVAEISDYAIGDQPIVLVNIAELKSRLQKQYPKTKKKSKALFFNDMAEEIRNTYPPEVYKAFVDKEKYAKLRVECSAVLRINHQNKKYGLTPIFRALPPTLMLEDFGRADRSTANARAKKIIHQKLHKEVMGEEYNRTGFTEQAYAHRNLLDAWSQKVVVVTTPPSVDSIEYVEPNVETTNISLIEHYRQKAMSTLGITFLAADKSSLSVANISVKQLMRTINKISRQLETILTKWYRLILQKHSCDPKMAPKVQIIDAEMMEAEVRNAIVDTLFTKLNCSYETAFEMLGVSIEDEQIRRERENKDKVDEIFSPRQTAYTTTGASNTGDAGGRPTGEDEAKEDKQAYDKERNKVT